MTPFRHWNLTIIATALALLLSTGCTSQGATADALREVRAATTQSLADTKADTAEIQRQIEALPADSPERKVLQRQLGRFNQIIAQVEAKLPLLDAAIATTQGGRADPAVIAAVSTIPGVGGYLSLALILGPSVWGLYENFKKRKATRALTQVVVGVDNALPVKTEEQRLKLAAAQDDATKAMVARAKAVH